MDAVITGLGIVSTIGHGIFRVVESLRNGTSGVRFLPERKKLGFRSALSGVIEDYKPRYPLSKKMRKSLPEFGQWTWDAIHEALGMAGINQEDLRDNLRVGIILGNDSSSLAVLDQVEALKRYGETRYIGSGYIFQLLNSTLTLNFSSYLGITGLSVTVSCACASGGYALGLAYDYITSGRFDVIICGGAQEINWQSMCSFDALGAFSTREQEPHKASRPFDRTRDGLVPSGGAAAIVVESDHHARKRRAEILATIKGYGFRSDGHHISIPNGKGLYNAMVDALKMAKMSAEHVDLVMAHATSTPAGDVVEAQMLARLFQIRGSAEGPIVCATKALTGHEFWMAGAAQVIYAILMAKEGFIAGNPNYEEPDPQCGFLRIFKDTTERRVRNIICNSSGFGGTNASVLITV